MLLFVLCEIPTKHFLANWCYTLLSLFAAKQLHPEVGVLVHQAHTSQAGKLYHATSTCTHETYLSVTLPSFTGGSTRARVSSADCLVVLPLFLPSLVSATNFYHSYLYYRFVLFYCMQVYGVWTRDGQRPPWRSVQAHQPSCHGT